MYYPKNNPLQRAVFIKRLNRFTAEVSVNGKIDVFHVKSSGRMEELLFEGNGVYIRYFKGGHYKTKGEVLLAEHHGTLVGIDSHLPNKIIEDGLMVEDGFFDIHKIATIKRESTYGKSRFDFLIHYLDGQMEWMEIKSVTLVEDGVALFPDAPTVRGEKHLLELIEAKKEGYLASVVFLVQREDAKFFSPNEKRDGAFTKALIEAKKEGVSIRAFTCKVSVEGVVMNNEIPVRL